MMKYTVKRIDEDLDFGCEERIEGTPVMAVVTLVDEEAHEMRLNCTLCQGHFELV